MVKIALVSAGVIHGDVDYNVNEIINSVKKCKGNADLVLFGETVLQGFECLCWNYERDFEVAVSMDAPVIWQIRKAARENYIAVSFGYVEKAENAIYSSQIVIGEDGEILHNFRRVSPGWKVIAADAHYCEGKGFSAFLFQDRKFAIGLCGDLWQEGRVEEMKQLSADIVLWPVWCDYNVKKWNEQIKYEYAQQVGKIGGNVLLVNPFCADFDGTVDCAAGGAAYFKNGNIVKEMSAGKSGILIVEVPYES